ncbi:MAG: thioredoxin family protein [Candidatus Aminicenantaceae bacterium]|jgi:thioredoxin 1
MSKLIATLIVLISCGLICARMNGGTVDRPQTEQNEEQLIISDKVLDFSQHKVTFIELGADKCIPCKAMQPVMREIAKEYKGIIQVVFYDVWKIPDYAKKYGIKVIPTQVFMDKDGKEIFRHVGFFAQEDIIKALKERNLI